MEWTPAIAQEQLDVVNAAIARARMLSPLRPRVVVLRSAALAALFWFMQFKGPWFVWLGWLLLVFVAASVADARAARTGASLGFSRVRIEGTGGGPALLVLFGVMFGGKDLLRPYRLGPWWVLGSVLLAYFLLSVICLVKAHRHDERAVARWRRDVNLPLELPRPSPPRLSILAALAPWRKVRIDRLARDSGLSTADLMQNVASLEATGQVRRFVARLGRPKRVWVRLTRGGRRDLVQTVVSLETYLGRPEATPHWSARLLDFSRWRRRPGWQPRKEPD